MKFSLRKNLKLMFLIALPIVLFGAARDKASWRPQSIAITAPVYTNPIAISPDDRLFARSGGHGEVFLSDLPDGKSVQEWKMGDGMSALRFSPDGKTVAAAWIIQDRIRSNTLSLGVTLRDAAGKLRELQPVTKVLTFDYPQQLRFSPDGKTIWLASTKNLRAWNVSSGKLQWQWHSGDLRRHSFAPTFSVAISEDCRFLFRYDGKTYMVWDIAQEKLLLQRKFTSFYGKVLDFSPDASLAMYADDKATPFNVVIDTRSGRELWRTDEKPVFAGYFAGDKVVFAQEKTFKVCHARTGKLLYELPANLRSIVLPAASKDWLYSAEDSDGDYFRQRFR